MLAKFNHGMQQLHICALSMQGDMRLTWLAEHMRLSAPACGPHTGCLALRSLTQSYQMCRVHGRVARAWWWATTMRL